MKKEITQEVIETFINGHDPMERIVNFDYKPNDNFITIIYRNENDQKCEKREPFKPFCWATLSACQKLCDGNREQVKTLMSRYKIGVKKLSNTSIDGIERHEFDDGYLFMFYAKEPMSYKTFQGFFKSAGNPIYSKSKEETIQSKSDSRQYLVVTPQEQFMISTGKRFFKGYDDYNELLKMTFDLETTGLDIKHDRIVQIGVRMNRPFKGHPEGFQKIINVTGDTEEDKNACELWAIDQMLKMIYTFQPDVITAHNGESFDWNFIISACSRLGTTIEDISSKYFKGDVIRKEEKASILKLGGEMEEYHQTIVPKITVTDSLHAVRRAQALDSNMLKADLKYVTKYSKLNKINRVYTPGEKISEIWADEIEHYAFCEENGNWYLYDENSNNGNLNDFKLGKDGDKPFVIYTRNYIADGYELKSGKYIVERYLFDDLWECDKVEHRYNTPNFLICKMLPVPYKKCTTMGTAGQWKALMLAWSYENNIAVPMFGENHAFTGGLSRLLKVGFVDDVAKFDYNSLYPSIILTWAISDNTDLMKAMLHFLEHVLSQREKYKKLKKQAGKKANAIKEKLQNNDYKDKEEEKALRLEMMKWKQEESANDKKQLPLKILGNSFFGSYGCPSVFPWGSLKCAEQTTCTGRQCLRLMISYFSNLGYEPIVGDSFTPDTPVFIKYNGSEIIDIKPISELINEDSIKVDVIGREYDYSKKDYKVLCRSGWVEPQYIYRHKTDKDIYEVSEGDMRIEVTEDHSLFNSNKEKLNPKNINEDTKLEYYTSNIKDIKEEEYRDEYVGVYACELADGKIDRVPKSYLNASRFYMKQFYETFIENYRDDIEYTKTCIAGLQYLKRMAGK